MDTGGDIDEIGVTPTTGPAKADGRGISEDRGAVRRGSDRQCAAVTGGGVDTGPLCYVIGSATIAVFVFWAKASGIPELLLLTGDCFVFSFVPIPPIVMATAGEIDPEVTLVGLCADSEVLWVVSENPRGVIPIGTVLGGGMWIHVRGGVTKIMITAVLVICIKPHRGNVVGIEGSANEAA